MYRAQTTLFLKEHGAQQLEITQEMFEQWPEQFPLLYVFPDYLPLERFSPLIEQRRPSIARVDRPTMVRQGGFLISGGQVDYYAIDPRTRKIYRVKQSNRPGAQYEVGIPYIYQIQDALFPKGPPVT